MKLGFIGLGIMGSPMAINHWGQLMLKLRVR